MSDREVAMSLRRLCRTGSGLALLLLSMTSALAGQDDPFTKRDPPPVVGCWDLTVRGPEGEYPSWLEVRRSGYTTLVGSFVGQFGSARPISRVEVTGNRFRFAIPPQWEKRKDDLVFEGTREGEGLKGTTTDEKG